MRRLVAVFAATLLAGAALAGGSAGGIAADFTRNDLSGHPVHLADFHGKVVLLNFWATWCGPCLEEIPAFSHWQQQYGPAGLQVIGVSMDDDEKPVQHFLQKTPLAYPVVMGDTALAKLYGGVLGLPMTYLIDAHGNIVARYLGGTDVKAVEVRIKKLLAH
jgi:cytochrome c biogenesis protein CcmG, thiol:disulfide interchange protein DsbE